MGIFELQLLPVLRYRDGEDYTAINTMQVLITKIAADNNELINGLL